MGYTDSMNAIKNDVASGAVEIWVNDGDVIFHGKTYPHKDFLKRELRGTNFHWDANTKNWKVAIESLYDGDKRKIQEMAEGGIWTVELI